MRKIIFLTMILTITVGCKNKDEYHEKFFESEKLDILNIANVDEFWDTDAIIDTSGAGQLFQLYPGFIQGISLFSKYKLISISVFETKDIAISAMESRINNVAAIINKGTTNKISGDWWYADDGFNSSLFVNKWNTILEVRISGSENETIEELLYNTANELSNRVDKLSE